jgi:uncharacterized membrane protein YcaP (DUF421 family)
MVNSVIYSFLRSIAAYYSKLVVTRLIGRKAISQMTFFDFALLYRLALLLLILVWAENIPFNLE